MIESLSRNVVLPIAGIILTFIACYELIEMITPVSYTHLTGWMADGV